jgi:hypothetical protein
MAKDIKKSAKKLLIKPIVNNKFSPQYKASKNIPKPKGMTCDELLLSATPNVKAKAKEDQVTVTSLVKRNNFIYSTTLTYDNSKSPPQVRKHKQYIQYFDLEKDGGKPFSKSKIKVSCTCDFHKYYLEYALTKEGASWIKFSNGEFPIVRNPKLKKTICKHMYVLLRTLKREGV